jgi:hypothetical protein
VYILILPAFGVVSHVIGVFSQKPVFGATLVAVFYPGADLIHAMDWRRALHLLSSLCLLAYMIPANLLGADLIPEVWLCGGQPALGATTSTHTCSSLCLVTGVAHFVHLCIAVDRRQPLLYARHRRGQPPTCS